MTEASNSEHRYFQHFKGGLYELLYIATNSETLEPYVVYRALYGENSVWVRPMKMFFEEVIIDSHPIPRFRELNQSEFECLQKKKKNI